MNALSAFTIYKAGVIIVIALVYAYGIYLWRLNKHHFIIAKRFPFISYLTVCIVFFNNTSAAVSSVLFDLDIISTQTYLIAGFVRAGCTFGVCALSVLRSFIVYQRFILMESILADDAKSTLSHPTKHIIFRILIVYTVIFIILLWFSPIIGDWFPSIPFGTLAVIIIVITFIMIRNKLKEGIGCIKEVIFVIFFSFMVAFLGAKFGSKIITQFFAFTFVSLLGVITLYLPLFYVYKINVSVKSINMEHSELSEVSDPETSMDSVSENIQLDLPLYVYLRNKENYTLFRQYLAHCFAVESLLFVESVVILCILLQKVPNTKTETDSQSKECTQISIDSEIQKLLDIKFEYLLDENMYYEEYQNKIQSVRDTEWEQQRMVYFELYSNIYNKFLTPNSLYEVNVSGDAKNSLHHIFSAESGVDTFKSLHDFTSVFDDALLETFELMKCVYAFNFQTYIKKSKR